MGKVYLVGGGPGDEGLLTLKGYDAIKKADCIVYDRLINPKLLDHAKESCEKIYVGKQNHHHAMKQEDINQLLVEKAKQHACVVRLKGGDGYVFGRGGEEGIFLREHNVAFEVIPGISSCIAGPAYAGIPITHRGIASGFHVVSAHNRYDELSDIDFAAMVKSEDTCVFLMGLSMLETIVQRLLQEGKHPKCPIAVIANATLPNQESVISTLDAVVGEIKQHPLPSPALIVAGNVVSLHEKLDFQKEKVLFHKKIIVPRVSEEPSALTKRLRALGADTCEVQVSHLIENKHALDAVDYQNYTRILLSSRHAVTFFMHSLKRNRIDIRSLQHIRFGVVGKATQETLQEYGIYAQDCPNYYTGKALCELLLSQMNEQETILIPKAKGAGENWQPLCDKAHVDMIDLYENQPIKGAFDDVDLSDYDMIVFTCSSAVKNTLSHVTLPSSMQVFSIGDKTSETLKSFGIREIYQSKQADYLSLINCMIKERK